MSDLKFRYAMLFSAMFIALISVIVFSLVCEPDDQNNLTDDEIALSVNILPQHTLTYNANGGYFTYTGFYMNSIYTKLNIHYNLRYPALY